MNKQYKSLSRKGFTLIELIVVIAIIGVLSAITIVSFNNYITKSKLTADLTDVKTVNRQLELMKINSDFKEPKTLSEIKQLIDSATNGKFNYIPRTANLGNHFIYNADTNLLELISENDWSIQLESVDENITPLVNNKVTRPNSIESFAWNELTPYIHLNEGGNLLSNFIKEVYQVYDLDSLHTLINKISNSSLKTSLKDRLIKQLNSSIIVSNNNVYKNFDDSNDIDHINVIFTKASEHVNTIIPDQAFVGIPLASIDLPEGIKVVGASAFADTGIKHATLPSTIETIQAGAFNNNNTTDIVLNIDSDFEKIESVLSDAAYIASIGSNIITKNQTLKVEKDHINSLTDGNKISFSNNIGEPLNDYYNKIKTLNLLTEAEILDNALLFGQTKKAYNKLANWELNYIETDLEFKEANDYFKNTQFPLFEDYYNEVNRLYELIKDQNIILNHDIGDTEHLDLLSYLPTSFNLSNLVSISKKDNNKRSISLGQTFGSYYCDNPGIENLVINFKGIGESFNGLTKEVTIYSEGVYGLSISKSIQPSSKNIQHMARFGNQNSFPIVIGLEYITKEGFNNVDELLSKFNVNYKLFKYENDQYIEVEPSTLNVRQTSLFIDSNGKHYYIVDLTVLDSSAEFYRFEAQFNGYVSYIEFVIIDAINVETAAELKTQTAIKDKNVVLVNNIVITTTGVDNEMWIDDKGLLTYRSNSVFATTTSTVQGGFTIASGTTLYGNNFTIDGTGMNGPHSTGSNDKKFLTLSDTASINNINIIMDKIPEYDNYGDDYTFSQATAVLYTTGAANIDNVHIEGGLRGIRIINKAGKTVNIRNSFFEGSMSNIEIYAGSSEPKSKCYINLDNVSIRTANSAAIDNGGHGVAILWFPGSLGSGGTNFDNIVLSETNTRIFSWLTKEEAFKAIKGALKGPGLSLSEKDLNSIVSKALFNYNGNEYLCTGMLIPFTSSKNMPDTDIIINTEVFNSNSGEVNVSVGIVIGYYTKYVDGDQMFIDYISDTWGTVDGEKWNGRLDELSNLKPIEQANQYIHHGLYK